MARVNPTDDGLNVAVPDVTTPEEVAAFRSYYARTKGRLPAWELLIEHRPDVLKRHRSGVRARTRPENVEYPLPHILSYLHLYTVVRFAQGIEYEMRIARSANAARSDILDTLAVAFLHCGAPGLTAVVESGAADLLRDWPESAASGPWPAGWSFDPDAFRSGLDWSTTVASREEMDRLADWYLRTLGEIPRSARFLMKHRPEQLKAYRNLLEHAVRDSLPKQMVAYLLIHLNVNLSRAEGIRESILLGKAFGMTRAQITDAIAWGSFLGGASSLAIVDEVASDVLDSLET
jgi:hypothetical protein